ncbi:hypothetical protein [Salinimicrobium marinum]
MVDQEIQESSYQKLQAEYDCVKHKYKLNRERIYCCKICPFTTR